MWSMFSLRCSSDVAFLNSWREFVFEVLFAMARAEAIERGFLQGIPGVVLQQCQSYGPGIF